MNTTTTNQRINYRQTTLALASGDYARVATYLRQLHRTLADEKTSDEDRGRARTDARQVERHLGTLRPRAHNQHQPTVSTGELRMLADVLFAVGRDDARYHDARAFAERVVREIDQPGTWEPS